VLPELQPREAAAIPKKTGKSAWRCGLGDVCPVVGLALRVDDVERHIRQTVLHLAERLPAIWARVLIHVADVVRHPIDIPAIDAAELDAIRDNASM
jgi:hypothetical protein